MLDGNAVNQKNVKKIALHFITNWMEASEKNERLEWDEMYLEWRLSCSLLTKYDRRNRPSAAIHLSVIIC